MLRRIAITITAALLTLTACGPEPFDTFDDVPADEDDEVLLAEFVGDDEGGDEASEGGMGSDPLPDMPDEGPTGACCICDTTNPAESWCEPANSPEDCPVGIPTTWQTGCEWVGDELVCSDAGCLSDPPAEEPTGACCVCDGVWCPCQVPQDVWCEDVGPGYPDACIEACSP